MALESVFIDPTAYREPWVSRATTDIIPNLVTYNLTAYNDQSGHQQTLRLGATSNLVLEARNNVDAYVSRGGGAMRVLETHVPLGTRQRFDKEILRVSHTHECNLTTLYVPGSLEIKSGDSSGGARISETTFAIASNQQVVSTTAPFGFLLDNNVQVGGNAFVNQHLVAVGNVYGNNFNVFRTLDDPNHDRVGFAFNINDNEQLELIKYARFFDADARSHRIILRRVATFGGQPFLMSDPSDSVYNGFDLLDGTDISTASNAARTTFTGFVGNGRSSGSSGSSGSSSVSTRGFNMQLDGSTRVAGDLVPANTSVYDLGASNLRFRNIYTTSLDVIGTSYYRGQPLVSSQWAYSGSNIHFSTGNVGIGAEQPPYPLTVNGEIAASGDLIAYSDARLKCNIERIGGALKKVGRLGGYTFEKTANQSVPGRRYAGLVAQEVQKVLPEVVHEDSSGFLSVAYGNMVGLLVEAVNELNAKVDSLNQQLHRCSINEG